MVVVLAVFMTNLDLWIVNVALPSMAASFTSGGRPASLSDLSWVLNAYAITLGALLVVLGRLGDRIGQRPVFLAGVVVFTVASIGCAVAPTLWVLVLARVVQAVGAAAQLPTSLALLLATVPAERRTTATRGWAAVGRTGRGGRAGHGWVTGRDRLALGVRRKPADRGGDADRRRGGAAPSRLLARPARFPTSGVLFW